ncbi:MAG: hypothetical protein JRH20_17375, partial [Deltaproteobacteria bacterium]|nr:hypothetical protein [Deltaproteobacteria bacterium]
MRSKGTLRRVLNGLVGLSLTMLIIGLAFWARADANDKLLHDSLALGVEATPIDKAEAQALAQRLNVAVMAKGDGHVELAMSVQAIPAKSPANSGELAESVKPATPAISTTKSTNTEPALAQKKHTKRFTKRMRSRQGAAKGDVSRTLLNDAAKLATKTETQSMKKAGGDAKQAKKMGSDAKARASKGAGGNAERPHASPESLRGQGHSGQSG